MLEFLIYKSTKQGSVACKLQKCTLPILALSPTLISSVADSPDILWCKAVAIYSIDKIVYILK